MEENKEKKNTRAQSENVNDGGLKYTVVEIPRTKKKYMVRTLTPNQLEDIAKLLFNKRGKTMTTEADIIQNTKIAAKAAALYLLPGYWKRKFTYWYLWRWFYYIKQYDNEQLQPIISAGYGSTPYVDFLQTMSILANQKDAQMRMTVQEAEKVMQEIAMKANNSSEKDKVESDQ